MDSPSSLSACSSVTSPTRHRKAFSFAPSDCSEQGLADLSPIDEAEATVPMSSPPLRLCHREDTPDRSYGSFLTMADRTLDMLAHTWTTPESRRLGTSPRMLLKRDDAWLRSPPRKLNLVFAEPSPEPAHQGSCAAQQALVDQLQPELYQEEIAPGISYDPILSETDLLSPLQVALSADLSSHIDAPLAQLEDQPEAAQEETQQMPPPTLSAEEEEHSFVSWDASQVAVPEEHLDEALVGMWTSEPETTLSSPKQEGVSGYKLFKHILNLLKLALLIQGVVSLLPIPKWSAEPTDLPVFSWADVEPEINQSAEPAMLLRLPHTVVEDEGLPETELNATCAALTIVNDTEAIADGHVTEIEEEHEIVEENTEEPHLSASWVVDHAPAIASGLAAFVFKRAW